MKQVDIYGIASDDLDSVRVDVEKLLRIQFVPRESFYHGGDYYSYSDEKCSFVLQRNFVDEDGELAEEDFPDALVLLYINSDGAEASEYGSKLKSGLQTIRLLKSKRN